MAVGVRPDDPMTELVCQDLRQYTILDGLLYCHDPKSKCGHPLKHLKLYVPTAIRGCLLKYYHDHPTAGYLSVAKTVARVRLRFFWLNLASNDRTYVASCVVCQDSKTRQRKPVGLMVPIHPQRPWEYTGVYYVGPLPRTQSGNAYVRNVLFLPGTVLLHTSYRTEGHPL